VHQVVADMFHPCLCNLPKTTPRLVSIPKSYCLGAPAGCVVLCHAVSCCVMCCPQAQVAATEKMLTSEKAKSATLQKQSSELTTQLSGARLNWAGLGTCNQPGYLDTMVIVVFCECSVLLSTMSLMPWHGSTHSMVRTTGHSTGWTAKWSGKSQPY
jgi:hypothetical protein